MDWELYAFLLCLALGEFTPESPGRGLYSALIVKPPARGLGGRFIKSGWGKINQ